jgi:membrane associated rhomboid family serine protease
MSTVTITKINAISLGKIIAIVYGVLGLIFGLFGVLFLLSQFLAPITTMEIISISMVFLLMPVMNIIIGFIAGVVIALIFNFMSRYTGGLELEIEEIVK